MLIKAEKFVVVDRGQASAVKRARCDQARIELIKRKKQNVSYKEMETKWKGESEEEGKSLEMVDKGKSNNSNGSMEKMYMPYSNCPSPISILSKESIGLS